jgi:hypothetical protein
MITYRDIAKWASQKALACSTKFFSEKEKIGFVFGYGQSLLSIIETNKGCFRLVFRSKWGESESPLVCRDFNELTLGLGLDVNLVSNESNIIEIRDNMGRRLPLEYNGVLSCLLTVGE